MLSRDKFFKIILPLLVLLLGLVLTQLLLGQRQLPESVKGVNNGALVEVLTIKPVSHQVRVEAAGTVQSQREVRIIPRVSGEVVELGPNFVSGGFVRAGELLFRLNPIDYQLALRQAEAALVEASANLQERESRAAIARLEWDLFQEQNAGAKAPSPLALHEPQLLKAQAALTAAQAALAAAQLNLERTEILAPFNARVRERHLEMGQFIATGSHVATLTGSDHTELVIPLPAAELLWLDLPGPGPKRAGSPALVTIRVGGQEHHWTGTLRRTLGEVEPLGRMIQAVIEVADPYGLERARRGPIELLPGLFAEVELSGALLPNVFTLPRQVIRENNTVWLLDKEQRLRIQPVNIIRAEKNLIVIDSGLTAGDRVITTNLTGVVDGLALRVNANLEQQSSAKPKVEQQFLNGPNKNPDKPGNRDQNP